MIYISRENQLSAADKRGKLQEFNWKIFFYDGVGNVRTENFFLPLLKNIILNIIIKFQYDQYY